MDVLEIETKNRLLDSEIQKRALFKAFLGLSLMQLLSIYSLTYIINYLVYSFSFIGSPQQSISPVQPVAQSSSPHSFTTLSSSPHLSQIRT